MLNLEELDDMSFSDLMKKSITEISVLCPEWTDFNAHDPGITSVSYTHLESMIKTVLDRINKEQGIEWRLEKLQRGIF